MTHIDQRSMLMAQAAREYDQRQRQIDAMRNAASSWVLSGGPTTPPTDTSDSKGRMAPASPPKKEKDKRLLLLTTK